MLVAGRIINMRQQKGFTLIELMITLIVLGAGIGALAYLQARLTTITVYSSAEYDAIGLASNKIASLHGVAYDDITAAIGLSDTTTVGNTVFTRLWTVVSQTSPTYKTIDVKVSWTDADNNAHFIKLGSAIAKTSPANAQL
jgi:prepilin-type N-terminal cleavage/methylation domain-containing protein